MQYQTNDIWKGGLYSSHQKCLLSINRVGIEIKEVDGKKTISEEDYIKLLQERAKSAKTETARIEVAKRFKEMQIKPIKSKEVVKAKRIEKRPYTANKTIKLPLWHQQWSNKTISLLKTVSEFFAAKPIIFVTLLLALSIQVHHLAVLVNRVGTNDSILLGYLFGSVAEITALLLTIHGADKRTLIIFAVIQAWVNILYYCDLPLLVTKITLSILIAYVVFSYSELYTESRAKA